MLHSPSHPFPDFRKSQQFSQRVEGPFQLFFREKGMDFVMAGLTEVGCFFYFFSCEHAPGPFGAVPRARYPMMPRGARHLHAA